MKKYYLDKENREHARSIRYRVEFLRGSWRDYAFSDNLNNAYYYFETAMFPKEDQWVGACGDRGIRLRSNRRIYDTENSSIVAEIKGMGYWKSITH